jgi:REP element-mobilizing transposase RayT
MRKTRFQNGKYYHIYNRGVEKRLVFMNEADYKKFIYKMRDHNNIKNKIYTPGHPVSRDTGRQEVEKLVDIIAFALLPNHFHLLLKQSQEKGVSKYLHKLTMGYSKYFNQTYKRTGALFQGRFNSVSIKSDEQLRYLSAYINSNAEIHSIAKVNKWKWSSYYKYLELNKHSISLKDIERLVDPKDILGQFKDAKEYREYVQSVISNSKQIKQELKNLQIE